MGKRLEDMVDLSRVERMLKSLPRKVAAVAVDFYNERFRQQGWLDKGLQRWKPRKVPEEGKRRAILVKSGRLRRSIRATSVTDSRVVIGTDAPYARIHNEGGQGTITQKVKAHSRREHSREAYSTRNGRKVAAGNVRQHTVRSHTRTIRTNVPQRQFMGSSDAMNKRMERMITREFDNIMK